DKRDLQGTGRTYMIDNYDARELNDRDRVSLDYDYEATSSDAFFTSARAVLYWQDLKKESGTNGRTAADVAYGRTNEIENKTWGFNGTVTKDFEYSNVRHSVKATLEATTSDWTQYSSALCPTPTTCPSLNNQSEVPDVESKTIGLSIEDKIEFGDTNFALTPGIRFDWFSYDPSTSGGFASNPALAKFGTLSDRSDQHVSPKVLATYELTPDVQLYTQLSSAFRAPTVDELYSRFYNAGGNYAQLGNPDLKPETGYGVEMGANFDTGDFNGRLAVFHNRYHNFIETVTSVNATTGITEFNYTNVSSVTISGIEASADKTFNNGINLHAALAYAYGRNEETTQRLRSVAPFKAIVGGGWSNETFGFDLSSTLSAGMLTDHLNTPVTNTADTTFDAPGYAIVDLTGWWTPDQMPGLRVQAGVYNIFDQEYFNALAVRDVNLISTASQPRDWYSEPGRTFKVSLTKTF
ncbi:MAG: TonB-dependent receptor, partial [Rhizobium ruizarguesonis]